MLEVKLVCSCGKSNCEHLPEIKDKECKCEEVYTDIISSENCELHRGDVSVKIDKEMSERFGKYYGAMFECGDFEALMKDINQEIQQALQRERELWLEKLPKKREEKPDCCDHIEGGCGCESRDFNECLQEVKEIINENK